MLLTLTTDFGSGSPYVAAMKGVILSHAPEARIVDLCHSVPPQDIRHGALVLANTVKFFPPSTLHVAVVDPGVGTARRILYCELAGQRFIAPDNGLLSKLMPAAGPVAAVSLTRGEYWLPEISSTFHGRDIMAPVAARLCLGADPLLFGEAIDDPVRLPWPEPTISPRSILGAVLMVDSFGNLITNISADDLRDAPRGEQTVIACGGHTTRGVARSYGERPPRTLLALVGSSGYLELAIAGGHAAKTLGADIGSEVAISW